MTALSLGLKPGIELLSVSWFDFSEMEIVYTCVSLIILTPCFTIQAQKQEGKKDAPYIKLTKLYIIGPFIRGKIRHVLRKTRLK